MYNAIKHITLDDTIKKNVNQGSNAFTFAGFSRHAISTKHD